MIFQRCYEFAHIATETFERKDPQGLNRVILNFEDGQRWVNRHLVFPVTTMPESHTSWEELKLPVGATVAVFIPTNTLLGHLDAVST